MGQSPCTGGCSCLRDPLTTGGFTLRPWTVRTTCSCIMFTGYQFNCISSCAVAHGHRLSARRRPRGPERAEGRVAPETRGSSPGHIRSASTAAYQLLNARNRALRVDKYRKAACVAQNAQAGTRAIQAPLPAAHVQLLHARVTATVPGPPAGGAQNSAAPPPAQHRAPHVAHGQKRAAHPRLRNDNRHQVVSCSYSSTTALPALGATWTRHHGRWSTRRTKPRSSMRSNSAEGAETQRLGRYSETVHVPAPGASAVRGTGRGRMSRSARAGVHAAFARSRVPGG